MESFSFPRFSEAPVRTSKAHKLWGLQNNSGISDVGHRHNIRSIVLSVTCSLAQVVLNAGAIPGLERNLGFLKLRFLQTVVRVCHRSVGLLRTWAALRSMGSASAGGENKRVRSGSPTRVGAGRIRRGLQDTTGYFPDDNLE